MKTLAATAVMLLTVAGIAQARPMTRPVSVNSQGKLGKGETLGSEPGGLSRDGRFIAFSSYSKNLVPGDKNGQSDIFRHDRKTGRTRIVSVSSAGKHARSGGDGATISAKGRFIAFDSFSPDLVPGDTNMTRCPPDDDDDGECQPEEAGDVFVRDVKRGRTTRVSVSSSGAQGNGSSSLSTISGNGRYVIFGSQADNLVPDDKNGQYDLFIRDRKRHTTAIVSLTDDDKPANGGILFSDVSDNGRYVAFSSDASNLVTGDTNGGDDVFLRDRKLKTTIRLTETVTQQDIGGVSISGNGKAVAIATDAPLDPADTNGERDIYVWTKNGVVRASPDASFNGYPGLSRDGTKVVYASEADPIGTDGNDGLQDVFVYDLSAGKVVRVSVSTSGTPGDSFSSSPVISADSRWVAFQSDATTFTAKNTHKAQQVYLRGPL